MKKNYFIIAVLLALLCIICVGCVRDEVVFWEYTNIEDVCFMTLDEYYDSEYNNPDLYYVLSSLTHIFNEDGIPVLYRKYLVFNASDDTFVFAFIGEYIYYPNNVPDTIDISKVRL